MNLSWKTVDHCPLCLSNSGQKYIGYRENAPGLHLNVYLCTNCRLVYNNPIPECEADKLMRRFMESTLTGAELAVIIQKP